MPLLLIPAFRPFPPPADSAKIPADITASKITVDTISDICYAGLVRIRGAEKNVPAPWETLFGKEPDLPNAFLRTVSTDPAHITHVDGTNALVSIDK